MGKRDNRKNLENGMLVFNMQNVLLILAFFTAFSSSRFTLNRNLMTSSFVLCLPPFTNKSTLLKKRFLNYCLHLPRFYFAFCQAFDWLEKPVHLSARTSQSEHKCFLVRANQIPTSAVRGAMFPALAANEHEFATVI